MVRDLNPGHEEITESIKLFLQHFDPIPKTNHPKRLLANRSL
jgi:hypothetical protein